MADTISEDENAVFSLPVQFLADDDKDDENAAFWLPDQFLTTDDFLVDKEKVERDSNEARFESTSRLELVGFNLRGESSASSIKTDKDEEDELMAELTRHLARTTTQETHGESNPQKSLAFSTSPQSTLSGFGAWRSWSGPSKLSSPPKTPPSYNAIFNNLPKVNQQGGAAWKRNRQERTGTEGVSCNALGLPESDWPPLRPQHRVNCSWQPSGSRAKSKMQPEFESRSGSGFESTSTTNLKRQSTGTGVFLPRRFGKQPETKKSKKPSGCTMILVPAKVIYALNLNLAKINVHAHSHSPFVKNFSLKHD